MAIGDVTVFHRAKERVGDGQIPLSGGGFKLALITNAQAAAAADADPRIGGSGDPEYTQVTAGGNYSAGGASISAVITDNWTRDAGTCTFDGDDVLWEQHASNPTNANQGILYLDDANDYALCLVDIGGAFDMTTGDLSVEWNASGIFTLA